MRFCGACGSSLKRRKDHAERRQLTVMFCDLVGSTELSERLDPEDLRDLVREYQRAASEVIERYGGHVAQYLGDGILVYFGYPQAHEDDPRRAVLAALGILGGMVDLNCRTRSLHDGRVTVRLGIHTGPVVAGEVGGGKTREMLAMGQTPNIAARLQGEAEPDTVVLSRTTLDLLRGLFVHKPLGARRLKGISEPFEIFEILRTTDFRNPYEILSLRGLAPWVGRGRELRELVASFDQLQAGASGHSLLLVGEAGIGKSRLVYQFQRLVAGRPHRWLVARCSAYQENSPLHPIVESLSEFVSLQLEDSSPTAWDTLERVMAGSRDPALAVLGDLLSLPRTESHPLPELSPAALRESTLNALIELLGRLGRVAPLVLVVEDLHWADPSTLELLGRLIERLESHGVLLILTARLDFAPSWLVGLKTLRLSRFSDSESVDIIRTTAGEHDLSEDKIRYIVERADGNPLFLEELTHRMLESAPETGSGAETGVPPTLQGLLSARLDQLGDAKETAQLAATIGREFSHALLTGVSTLGSERLMDDLKRLSTERVVVASDSDAEYVFRHALLQEAAYESMTRKQRMKYHDRVATFLEQNFPEMATSEPHLMARHFGSAARFDRAVDYALLAGSSYHVRSAEIEAVEQISQGLDWLESLEDSVVRAEKELELRGVLAPALMATRGFGASELEECLNRSLELLESLGSSELAFPTKWGLRSYYLLRARHEEAVEMAEHNLLAAEGSGDSGQVVEALVSAADSCWYMGRFEEAVARFERAEALYDAETHGQHGFIFGLDPRLFARAVRSLAIWGLGFPQLAEETLNESVTEAASFGHANTHAFVLVCRATLGQYRGLAASVAEHTGELLKICDNHGLMQWKATVMMLQGWADVMLHGRGLEALEGGLEAYVGTGARVVLPYWQAVLAEALLRLGEAERGLELVDDSLRIARETGETFYLAQLLQRRSDLLVCLGRGSEAEQEAALRESLEVATRQRARLLEVQTATRLSVLLARQDRGEEALPLLRRSCTLYPGDALGSDIIAAKQLVDELERDLGSDA